MVQVVPNTTDLEGVVTSHAPHPQLPGFDLLVVQIERATPVPGVADLLSQRLGAPLDILAPRDHVPPGISGQRIRFRAQLAGPGVVRLDPTVPIMRIGS